MTLRPRWRTLLTSVAVLSATALVTVYVRVLMRVDPFITLRNSRDVSNPIELEFQDVALKHWHKGKLVAQGQIGRLDIRRDRQLYDMYDIHDGVYYTDKSKFQFDGTHAMWFPANQRLEEDRGGHVKGQDFEFQAPSFQYGAQQALLTVHGPAIGTLDGGRVTVSDVVYNVGNGAYTTGAVDWRGKFDVNLQNPDQSGPKPTNSGDDNKLREWWHHADRTIHGKKKSDPSTFENVRGTDGDSIVTAPEATYDRDKEIIVCTKGPIKYWSAKINLVCDHLTIYRKEHRAVATGNVVAYIKQEDKQELDDKMEVPPFKPTVPDEISKSRPPAPMNSDPKGKELDEDVRSNDSIKKYPATVRCEKVVYFYKKGSRHADITGAPEAQQELPEGRWRMAWAHHAAYDGEAEVLYLYSASEKQHDVRMKNSIGDDFTAVTAQMSTKDGDESYEAKEEQGVYASTDEEANEAASKAAKDKKKPGSTTPSPTKSPISGPIGLQS